MRRTKKITIEGQVVEIKEITTKAMFLIFEKFPDFDGTFELKMLPTLIRALLPFCSNLSLPQFEDMVLADLILVKDAFIEVNPDFFNQMGTQKNAIPLDLQASRIEKNS